jgi:rhomboid family GlyGly-CTERM serine protease
MMLDWQPDLAAREPWRAWSAAWVHWSATHLVANLVGTALVAALGQAGRIGWPWALAWAFAWPLAHAGLWLRPELLHYGGLSGVLHAGVAVAAVALWADAPAAGPAVRQRQRLVAAAVALGLVIKIVSEAPWGPALRRGDGWDIAVAPLAHASGAVAGLACALVVAAWRLTRRRQQRRGGPGESARP